MTPAPRQAAAAVFTAAQRTAILSEGHTLLEAGAGSGKTTTLVGKILHSLGAEVVAGELVSRACALSEIAAITFTTAAAADLRRALRDELRAHAKRTGGDRRWHRLVYEVDRARIGTIHSYCTGILREFALRDGRDPAFAVLDGGETTELREHAARATLYAALGADDPDAGELAFQFGVDGAVKMVRAALEQGDAARDAALNWCDVDGRAKLAELQARVEGAGRAWRRHDAAGAELAATVLRLAGSAQSAFDEQLERRGALDYDALVSRTRDLLERSPEARAGLRRRLRWLFIDEFQDTDPAQRDIAYLICGVSKGDGERKAAASMECPSLCIIGDPKQSIYGFRRADVSLWMSVKRDFGDIGATVAALDVNYRSRAPLVGYVNGVFGALMKQPDDETSPDYEVRYGALFPHRDYAGDDGLVELLVLPESANVLGRRTTEAVRIAQRIRAMVQNREPVVWDGGAERKPVSYRDVALLFRSTSDIRLYEAELRRLAVPCYVAAGDGFFATREITDVRLLLAALVDAHDDVAWMGLLRSPMIGLSDDALFRLRRMLPPDAPFSHVLGLELPDADADRDALTFARGWIDELRQLRDRVSCASLVERGIERSGYAATLLYQPGGDVALANVRKLVNMADGRPEESVSGFVSWLVARGESSARESEAALHTAGEDVVTLSTIHGAKGLEWPVVFLVDLDRGMGGGTTRAPSLYLDPSSGIAVKLEDAEAAEGETKCGAYEWLHAEAGLRDVAEDRRVWYVASTRARDRLVLCAELPAVAEEGTEPARTAASWLLGGMQLGAGAMSYTHGVATWAGTIGLEPGREAGAAPLPPPRVAELPPDVILSPSLERQLAPIAATMPLLRRSATELMTFDRDPAAHRRSYLLGLRPSPYGAANGAAHATGGNGNNGTGSNGNGSNGSNGSHGHTLDARTLGNIVHTVMELDAAAVARDLDRILEREIIGQLGAEGAARLAPDSVARLRRLIEETGSHPAVARLTGGAAVERELPFTWFVEVDGVPNVVHGAMDLVARVGAALEILDFKTHLLVAGEEAAAAAGYDLQRDVYAAALAEIIGAPAAFSFFFPETGRNVLHSLNDGDIADGQARLRAVLREVARAVGVVGGGAGEPHAAVAT